jgi:predicted ATPase with chaperone activity
MDDSLGKLSPAEFLAALKGREAPLYAPPESGNGSDPLAGLDFSDLEGPAATPAAPPEHDGLGEDADIPRTSARKPVHCEAIKNNARLSDLFDRVSALLGSSEQVVEEAFRPKAPEVLADTGMTAEDVEKLILKYLLAKGTGSGRTISSRIRLPYQIVDPILKQLKQEQLVVFKGAAEMGDYDFAITDHGRERARRYSEECGYFGPAPVALADYLEAMERQSICKQEATEEALREAFADLVLDEKMLEKLGPAVNSGRGMFLFGEPGNGKTSIAERLTRCFGSTIWIPRAIGVDGEIIRLYDPGIHDAIDEGNEDNIFKTKSDVDKRWVQILRPTVIAGGELTMQELEVTQNPQTKICEAPLQLKSNCGTLVIDDFGRQVMPVEALLNRWIVPLEKRYDFLNLPSGKKIQVPFDQLIIFSTNLDPKDLVDGAFLRRIPYKIHVADPTEEQFHRIFQSVAPTMGFAYDKAAVDYLIEKHYRGAGRGFRACHPRDLLLQVRNFCTYKRAAKKMSPEAFDFAVENYFTAM